MGGRQGWGRPQGLRGPTNSRLFATIVVMAQSPTLRTRRIPNAVAWTVIVFAIATAVLIIRRPAGIDARGLRASICYGNMRELASMVYIYAEDFDDQYAPAKTWTEALSPYTARAKDVFACPTVESDLTPNKPYGYAYNDGVAGRKMGSIKSPANTVAIFESNRFERNLQGGKDLLAIPGRHGGSNNIAFADGHAKALKPEETLIWNTR